MSLFLQQKVHPAGDAVRSVSHLSWNPVQPLLAVIYDNTRLSIFSFKNSKLNEEFSKNFQNNVTSISWPATGAKLLAVVTENSELYCIDAGQTAAGSYKLHQHENSYVSNRNHGNKLQNLCWTKNGGRLILSVGREVHGIRFEARSGIFQKIFSTTYLSEISVVKPLKGLNCVITSVSGDIANLVDQEVVQIAKLPTKTSITNLLIVSDEKYVILSDVLIFMEKGKITFTVKLVKEAKIILQDQLVLAYYHLHGI